jgi:glycosyltransferase involved in cell wall biosynthesis
MTPVVRGHQPLVSILMVAFRPHPRYFREAVQSILAQTFADWELVIVEDPSPCCGRELLDGLHDPRIRHIVNPQRTSLIAQRNHSLAQARADLVAPFDTDDLCEPDRLLRQVDFLKDHPDIGAVGSQVAIIDSEGRRLGSHSYPLTHEQVMRNITAKMPMCLGSTMCRKPLLQDIGGFQPGVYDAGEDYELVSRLALRGVRFANLPQTLFHYRFHPGQMKATRLRETIRAVLQVKERYWLDRMSIGDKVRMGAERCLLWLPKPLVYRLVVRLRYRAFPRTPRRSIPCTVKAKRPMTAFRASLVNGASEIGEASNARGTP